MHLKAHSGEKSNKYNQCDYASSLASDLRIHLKVHSGKKSKQMQPMSLCFLSYRQFEDTFKTHRAEKSNQCRKHSSVAMLLCFLSCRRFEDTFKNAHWRKVKQMQSMRLCFLSCRRFEENVHFLICCNSVQNLVIGWRLLHWFQSWLPGWVTYIATLPCNALLTLSLSIGLVSLSVRVISVKFQKPLSLTYRQTDRHRDT